MAEPPKKPNINLIQADMELGGGRMRGGMIAWGELSGLFNVTGNLISFNTMPEGLTPQVEPDYPEAEAV